MSIGELNICGSYEVLSNIVNHLENVLIEILMLKYMTIATQKELDFEEKI